MPQEEIITLIQKYVALLNTEGLSVRKAFLFGSYATGLATKNSDIDVMIVSDKFDEADDRAAGKMWQLTKQVHTGIEPFLIGINKFNNDNNSLLINTIKQHGIEVVSQRRKSCEKHRFIEMTLEQEKEYIRKQIAKMKLKRQRKTTAI